MLTSTLALAVGFMATAAIGQSPDPPPESQLPFLCGAESPSADAVAQIQQLFEPNITIDNRFGASPDISPIVIQTFVHVVAPSEDEKESFVSNDTITAQMQVINEVYHGSNIRFELSGISRTGNSEWTQGRDEAGMKKALHRGDYTTLNIYLVQQAPQKQIGLATNPLTLDPTPSFSRRPSEEEVLLDGIYVSSFTLPNGSPHTINQHGIRYIFNFVGHTAAHEAGHWLGLLHTFTDYSKFPWQDRTLPKLCSAPGDGISDTPAHLPPRGYGCEASKLSRSSDEGNVYVEGVGLGKGFKAPDSCPDTLPNIQKGLDPVNNLMNYNLDTCLVEITPGQIERMHRVYNEMRAPYGKSEPSSQEEKPSTPKSAPTQQKKPTIGAAQPSATQGGNRPKTLWERQKELCESIKRDGCTRQTILCASKERQKPLRKNFEEAWQSIEQCVKSFYGI